MFGKLIGYVCMEYVNVMYDYIVGLFICYIYEMGIGYN